MLSTLQTHNTLMLLLVFTYRTVLKVLKILP